MSIPVHRYNFVLTNQIDLTLYCTPSGSRQLQMGLKGGPENEAPLTCPFRRHDTTSCTRVRTPFGNLGEEAHLEVQKREIIAVSHRCGADSKIRPVFLRKRKWSKGQVSASHRDILRAMIEAHVCGPPSSL